MSDGTTGEDRLRVLDEECDLAFDLRETTDRWLLLRGKAVLTTKWRHK